MAVSPNMYELTYIVNAVISDDQIKEIIKRVTAYIKESGAEITEVDEWGSRRLAYPIQKKRNGYYVNVYFRSSGDFIPRLERVLEIDDNILRYLTLRLDAKMIRYYESNQDSRARLAGRGGDETEAGSGSRKSARPERKAAPAVAVAKDSEVAVKEEKDSKEAAAAEAVPDTTSPDIAVDDVAVAEADVVEEADVSPAEDVAVDADVAAEPAEDVAVDADVATEPAGAEDSSESDGSTDSPEEKAADTLEEEGPAAEKSTDDDGDIEEPDAKEA